MLQIYKSPSVQGREGDSLHDVPSSEGPSPAEQLARFVGFIQRRYAIILSVLPLTTGLAVVYLLTTPPLYQGQASLLVDTGQVQVFQESVLREDPVNLAIESQLEILKSENFARSIITKLQLTHDPEFTGFSAGPISRAISLLFHPFASLTPQTESELMQQVVREFEGRLSVSRVGLTYVIEIGFLSNNPDRSAQIANAVANGFIDDQLEARYQAIRKAMTWMQDRLNELQAQASAADRAVIDYKTQHNIVDTNGHLINDQELTDLNSSLIKARADVLETKTRLDRVSQILDGDNIDPTDTDLSTVADSLHNEIITKLREEYLDLAQHEDLLSKKLGHDHLAVVNLRNQMAEINHSIIDELRQISEAYRSDYDIAKARESSVEKSLAETVSGSQTTNKAQIDLRQLDSAAKSYRTLYDTLEQRYTETVQQQSLPTTNARVITQASRPLGKTSPKSFRTLAIATMGGLVLGLGLALLREISDRVFRTSDQVEAALKTECLALIPMIVPTAHGPSVNPESTVPRVGKTILGAIMPRVPVASVATGTHSDIATPKTIAQNAGILRQVVNAPLSRFSELIRAVKLGADLGDVDKPNKVIGITSSLPNEGKSTIAVSLAQVCAASARVILVDCDLRHPLLSQKLAPDATAGLIDVITESASLEDVIWTDPSTTMSFLPVAAKWRLTHTSEILASHAVKQLFDQLRASYDYVIVDLSPLAPVVDVRSTVRLVDSYLLVVEWGKTKIDVVEHALSNARGVHDNLLGMVLNKVDLKLLVRYASYHNDYYYNRHYSRYGYTD